MKSVLVNDVMASGEAKGICGGLSSLFSLSLLSSLLSKNVSWIGR